MATVNEYLMQKGLDQYIWAFATQGFEGRECLRELMSLDEVGLDRLATQTLRNAERALGVVSVQEPDEHEKQYVTSVLPGLYIEIPTHRLGRAKGKTFTEYAVDVHTVDRSLAAQTWHRYSEFEELRKQMEKSAASKADAAALPKLPKKKTVGSQSDAVVLERQQQLRIFLERLLVHLRSGPKAARELLDTFLGLPVEIKLPEPARSSTTAATEAVAVKLPPKLQVLADRLELERAEVDEILDSYDHDVDQAITFLREEYSEQLDGDGDTESEEDEVDETALGTDQYRDSIDDLGGGWAGADRYDPRSTFVEDQVTTIDEADRAQVEESKPILRDKFSILDAYFAADVEHRHETQSSDGIDEEGTGEVVEVERIDLESGLRVLQLEQYLEVLMEYEFDDPSLWGEFDEEEWSDMFEMMEIDPSHRKVLMAWFTNPAAHALITESGAIGGGDSGGSRERDSSPSPARAAQPQSSALSSPIRTQRSSDESPRRLTRHDSSSPSPQASRASRLVKSTSRNANARTFTMPEFSPRPPLQHEPDRGFGDGFFPGAALPRPRRTSAHIALGDGGGASSGPLFSVVYTEGGVTHAWSEAGAGEMRAACADPKLTSAHGHLGVPELDAAGDVWTSDRLRHRTTRRPRHGSPYKLVNDAHSQTIGPNMSVCISTLIETYQQEAESLQVVQGIMAVEALEGVKRRDSYRRGAVISTPGQAPRAFNGWVSGPLCSVSKLPLASGPATDGSTAVLAQRGNRCVRGAHIELLSSRVQHSEEGRPDAGAPAPSSRDEIAQAFRQELDTMKAAEEDGQIELLAEVAAIEDEIEQLKNNFLAASDEEKKEMASELRVTRDRLLMDLARAKREAVLHRAKAHEQLMQRTRLMRAQMEDHTSAEERMAAAAARDELPAVGPVMEAARAAVDPRRDPRQQLAAWKQAAAERTTSSAAVGAGTDEQAESGVSCGALDKLNQIFTELSDGEYKNEKYGLDKMLPAVPATTMDTSDWAEHAGAVGEADWSTLLAAES